ncbi:CbtA family protein [Jatrophihabitans sp. DSM 45814]
MEIRIILRGVLSGAIAGVLGFIFARIFAEPYIQQAIDYESGRDDAIASVAKSLGVTVEPDGPEIFSRTIQANIGVASGIIGFSAAMGALVAVTYLVLHGRFGVRPRTLALFITGLGFLGVYMVPFVKYPANPPSIGHTFTIATRAHLYLTMVACSLIFLGLAVFLGHRIRHRFGTYNATLIAAGAFIVLISIVMAVLPSLGHLAANKAVEGSLGYGKSATETPLPVTDPQGHIVYPGFSADVLWKFRFYSIIAQLIIWTTIGLTFSYLVERFVGRPATTDPAPREVITV